jgi:hypothetical protein
VVGQQRQRARGLRDANSHDPQGAAANERQIAPDAVVLDYKAPPASVCSNSAGRSILFTFGTVASVRDLSVKMAVSLWT